MEWIRWWFSTSKKNLVVCRLNHKLDIQRLCLRVPFLHCPIFHLCNKTSIAKYKHQKRLSIKTKVSGNLEGLERRLIIILLGLSASPRSLLCKRHATMRKIEHIPNIKVIGNSLTFNYKKIKKNQLVSYKERIKGKKEIQTCFCFFGMGWWDHSFQFNNSQMSTKGGIVHLRVQINELYLVSDQLKALDLETKKSPFQVQFK